MEAGNSNLGDAIGQLLARHSRLMQKGGSSSNMAPFGQAGAGQSEGLDLRSVSLMSPPQAHPFGIGHVAPVAPPPAPAPAVRLRPMSDEPLMGLDAQQPRSPSVDIVRSVLEGNTGQQPHAKGRFPSPTGPSPFAIGSSALSMPPSGMGVSGTPAPPSLSPSDLEGRQGSPHPTLTSILQTRQSVSPGVRSPKVGSSSLAKTSRMLSVSVDDMGEEAGSRPATAKASTPTGVDYKTDTYSPGTGGSGGYEMVETGESASDRSTHKEREREREAVPTPRSPPRVRDRPVLSTTSGKRDVYSGASLSALLSSIMKGTALTPEMERKREREEAAEKAAKEAEARAKEGSLHSLSLSASGVPEGERETGAETQERTGETPGMSRPGSMFSLSHTSPLPGAQYSTQDRRAKAVYYADYLRHAREEVRFGALEALAELGVETLHAYPDIVSRLLPPLSAYRTQEPRFLSVALGLLRDYAEAAAEAQPILLTMLRDVAVRGHRRAICEAIVSVGGVSGLSLLLREVTGRHHQPVYGADGTDCFVLTFLANLPFIQAAVVVPPLVEQCHSRDASKRLTAIHALTALRAESTAAALPVLISQLQTQCQSDRDEESVDIARAIRSCGDVGSAVLCALATQPHRARQQRERDSRARLTTPRMGTPRHTHRPLSMSMSPEKGGSASGRVKGQRREGRGGAGSRLGRTTGSAPSPRPSSDKAQVLSRLAGAAGDPKVRAACVLALGERERQQEPASNVWAYVSYDVDSTLSGSALDAPMLRVLGEGEGGEGEGETPGTPAVNAVVLRIAATPFISSLRMYVSGAETAAAASGSTSPPWGSGGLFPLGSEVPVLSNPCPPPGCAVFMAEAAGSVGMASQGMGAGETGREGVLGVGALGGMATSGGPSLMGQDHQADREMERERERDTEGERETHFRVSGLGEREKDQRGQDYVRYTATRRLLSELKYNPLHVSVEYKGRHQEEGAAAEREREGAHSEAGMSLSLSLEALSSQGVTLPTHTRNESSVIVQALCDTEHEVVSAALRALTELLCDGRCRNTGGLTPLCAECLSHESSAVREAACLCVGLCIARAECTDRAERQALASALKGLAGALEDRRWRVRFRACLALRMVGPGATAVCLPLLVTALREGSLKRTEIGTTIAALGREGQVTLAALLGTSTSEQSQVRVAAAHGLSFLSASSPAAEACAKALCAGLDDRQPGVRSAVLFSLGSFSQRANGGVTFLRSRSLLPRVYARLKDNDRTVREAACTVLAHDAQGELLLIRGLLKDQSPVVRASAAMGLGKTGPRSLRTLLLAHRDRSPAVRSAVGDAILSFDGSEVLDVLDASSPDSRHELLYPITDFLASPLDWRDEVRRVLRGIRDHLTSLAAEDRLARDELRLTPSMRQRPSPSPAAHPLTSSTPLGPSTHDSNRGGEGEGDRGDTPGREREDRDEWRLPARRRSRYHTSHMPESGDSDVETESVLASDTCSERDMGLNPIAVSDSRPNTPIFRDRELEH
ncbi:hypothetical protein KIPB_004423 [Kipferlia bialata]|uniref:Uncharacterized protein n=1 Tax=Kipferlia bialata TaxID=797122 RepID=A0A9K3CWY7_9EUKA|nr:hypothetical protein KIPB_004423 [Kipferlia bialata]|eukprot:g4423.t1